MNNSLSKLSNQTLKVEVSSILCGITITLMIFISVTSGTGTISERLHKSGKMAELLSLLWKSKTQFSKTSERQEE